MPKCDHCEGEPNEFLKTTIQLNQHQGHFNVNHFQTQLNEQLNNGKVPIYYSEIERIRRELQLSTKDALVEAKRQIGSVKQTANILHNHNLKAQGKAMPSKNKKATGMAKFLPWESAQKWIDKYNELNQQIQNIRNFQFLTQNLFETKQFCGICGILVDTKITTTTNSIDEFISLFGHSINAKQLAELTLFNRNKEDILVLTNAAKLIYSLLDKEVKKAERSRKKLVTDWNKYNKDVEKAKKKIADKKRADEIKALEAKLAKLKETED